MSDLEVLEVLFGVPVSEFPDPPEDLPGCEKYPCDWCGFPLWLGQIKKKLKLMHPELPVVCGHCLKKEIEKEIENERT